MSSLNLTNFFPFRVFDTSLPQNRQDYIDIISRLNQHNSGYRSSSTTPFHRRPYAIMGFICGVNGNKNSQFYQGNKFSKPPRRYLR